MSATCEQLENRGDPYHRVPCGKPAVIRYADSEKEPKNRCAEHVDKNVLAMIDTLRLTKSGMETMLLLGQMKRTQGAESLLIEISERIAALEPKS